jgi:hypothetical protein
MNMLRRKTAIISGLAGLALAGAVAGGVASAESNGSGTTAAAGTSVNSGAASSSTDADAASLVAQTAGLATPATTAKGEGDGAKALCRRAPRLEKRIERVLTRLNGPATEKGSIAYLQERVQDAQAKGDTAVATYLNDRLTFRKSLVGTLQQRETDLKSVQSWCTTNKVT